MIGGTTEHECTILIVVDKESRRLKIMSLDHQYSGRENINRIGFIRIEYKTDESIECDNMYDFEYSHEPINIPEVTDPTKVTEVTILPDFLSYGCSIY
jgi:hypothetical protein